MLNNLKFRLQLIQLESHSRKLSNNYLQVEKRIKNKSQYDYLELQDILRKQVELQKWIEFQQTQHYQQNCNRYIIPMPKKEDGNYYKFNFDDDGGDKDILTIKGFQIVRNSIRKEKKEILEAFGFWSSLIIGLIGAAIGLISAIKN